MKKLFIVTIVVQIFSLSISTAGENSKGIPGEKLFTQHCAVCHPQGGNIINPKKTLGKNSLAANNIKTEEDVVKLIRDGAPGMTKFDENAISKQDAREIARYILKTFK